VPIEMTINTRERLLRKFSLVGRGNVESDLIEVLKLIVLLNILGNFTRQQLDHPGDEPGSWSPLAFSCSYP